MLELLKPAEIRTLHQSIGHRLHDEDSAPSYLVISVVKTDERLQETNDDDDQERKEDD